MDRRSIRCRTVLVVLLVLAACVPLPGCKGAMITAYHLVKGTDDAADYAGLRHKTVVVVCRPLITLQYQNSNVGRELSKEVSQLLQANVRKIKIVDQRKATRWIDENTWDDYPEVGKAMNADMVVGIDLEGFSLFEGQTLYRGRANTTVHVYDCTAGGKEVFTRTMPPTVYPPNTDIPTSDRQEGDFRREFVQVLADRVARHFYTHDRNADVAQDAAAIR